MLKQRSLISFSAASPESLASDVDLKQVVSAGYNDLGEKFAKWAATVRVAERSKYARLILNTVQAGQPVLDLGCGPGGMIAQLLAGKYSLTGIDLAENQLVIARRENSGAEFICADMMRYPLSPNHFAAVIAFYSLFHLPRAEQPLMLAKIYGCLRPGGFFVGTFGMGDHEVAMDDDFLGVQMFSSSFDPETNVSLIRNAGFQEITSEVESETEFERQISFQWITAHKP
jgi:SAM-dependent methyltransferase